MRGGGFEGGLEGEEDGDGVRVKTAVYDSNFLIMGWGELFRSDDRFLLFALDLYK